MNATIRISNRFDHMSEAPALRAAHYLAVAGIAGNVTSGFSSVDRQVETSLAVSLFDVSPAQVIIIFRWLRDTFSLTCAWLDCDAYHGCIKEWGHWK